MKLTSEEMQKIAISLNMLTGVGGFLTKTMPNAFKAIQTGSKAIGLVERNATKVGLIGAGVGGVGGAISGAKTEDPANRGKSMLMRGALGAAAGFYGGSAMAKKMPTFGSHYEAAFKPVGEKMLALAGDKTLTAAERGKQLTSHLAENLKTQIKPLDKGNKIMAKTKLGRDTEATGEILNPHLPAGGHIVGEAAQGLQNIRQHGVFKGVGKSFVKNFKDSQVFHTNKIIGNVDNTTHYQFNRSTAGKVISPLANTGVGMGLLDAATASNEDGSKPTIGKRLRTGAKSTLTWGVAPRLMMGKAMAYDIPKTFMGGNKQPQQDINKIGV